MKVSVNWAKEFTTIDLPINKLAEKIGAQLGAVEEVIDLGKKYKGILVVKVVECVKHPNADKLSLCMVDDGGVNKTVKRSANNLIQVVCGAPNVKTGMLAAWIPPGATVPASFGGEPFVIEARAIRNKTSHGMLASAKELAIGDSHEGLLVLEAGKPGDEFVKTLWLDDYIIDIENKMFTHRPDLFGQLGVAREIAGITGRAFKSPDWYQEGIKLDNDGRKNVLKLKVKNDIPKLVPRFCAVAFKDIKVEPSPAWLQSMLARVGVRPINNIVDITNLVMLETGQPMHAYDYDKLKTSTLGARMSKKGEELKIIGGKTIKLEHEAVVITDGDKPVGLGGVMGGADTEVDEKTKNIILEAATFDMNTTRRTAMAYGLFTDAATRFTKGQSPLQNMAAVGRAASLIKMLAGGRQATPVVDSKNASAKSKDLKITTQFVGERLGLELSAKEIQKLLENVEFKVTANGNSLSIVAPFWRTDIEIPEDIVEELGRLYGYDKLPQILPKRSLSPAEPNDLLGLKARLRTILATAGANEVLTYSFVHSSLLQKVDQPANMAYQLRNALSPDLQYYRLSVMPSLLDKIYPNIRAGYDQFALFELGKGHNKKQPTDGVEKVPTEFNMLALAVTDSGKSANKNSGAAFFQAKAILDFLAAKLGITLKYEAILEEQNYPVAKPYDYKRSAKVSVAETGHALGMVGEFNREVIRNLKLPQFTAGFEIGISELLTSLPKVLAYEPLPRFPKVEQDISLRVPASVNYGELYEFIVKKLNELKPADTQTSLEPIDFYQNEKAHKHLAFRLAITSFERTLTAQEVNKLLDTIASQAKTKLKAERI